MNLSSLLAFTAKVDSAYAASCQQVLEEFDLSKTSFDILMFLSNHRELYTAKDICLYRGIKPNVVSQHVEKLVQEGYLERRSVQEDRRMVRLVCTEKAEPVTHRGSAVQRAFLEGLVDGLSKEDLAVFRECFRTIGNNAHRMQIGTNVSNGGISKC